MRVAVFGGYGTFGKLVARALAERGLAVTVAGRDGVQAAALAATLPPVAAGPHEGISADVTRAADVRRALAGCVAAASCAGPFSALGQSLLDGCLDAGCHYADISDDRDYARQVRATDARFKERNLSAIYGCSSLPAVSGALALVARDGNSAAVERARVTLFIGNHNPKGGAAIRSVLDGVGKEFPAPQGPLKGFGDREVVELPPPFKKRAVYNFESPEYDLFPALVGARAVSVKVGFELRSATFTFAMLARLSSQWGPRTAGFLEKVGALFGRAGTSGGAVMTELFLDGGGYRKAVLHADGEGQRMVALPCAIAIARLCEGPAPRGAMTAYELMGARPLLDRLCAEGFHLAIS
jgi:hypothetical protein